MTPKQLIRHIKHYYWHLAEYSLIRDSRLYERWEQYHLKRLLDYYAVDCVFDVGANHGQYAQMLRKKAGYKGLIISFEPIPEAAAYLRKCSSNDSLWLIEELALSNQDGTQTFNVMSSSQFSSLSAPRHDETDMFSQENHVDHAVSVRTELLDTAYARLHATYGFKQPFLKLDTQGYDLSIIEAASNPILERFIGLQSELAVKKLYADSVDFRTVLSRYEERGFTLSAFVPNNAGHFPLLVETDCIMIRSSLLDTPPSGTAVSS